MRKDSMEKVLQVVTLLCLASQGLSGCGFPGAPAHSSVRFSEAGAGEAVSAGTIAEYTCDRGFELLGPARRVCGENGTWSPQGIPFCVLNVAAGKAPMQSSVAEGGIPQKAVDGSTSTFFDLSTCSLTEVEKSPWWYVNLLEPYMVQLVRIDFGQSCCAKGRKATIVVRVGNNRPDLGVNPICNRFTGLIEEGRPLFLPCNPPMPGAFVSVHFEGPPGVSLSICEAFVYTDQALPIERCPTFRDQKPGSTATYNGKCYIFNGQQPKNFIEAKDFCEERGGSLVDESNPALQGFLSWELWRRHRGDPNGQYWLGMERDPVDPKNWKWLTDKTVTVSFWNLPGGDEDCARFDGTKGWLWSDTNCLLKLNYICQHRPTTCGKPEQPPNSTLISTDSSDYEVGSRIEYVCDEGHLLVGPAKRNCLATGFYSEFPPVCRYLECGMPADIVNGKLRFVNGTRQFKSVIAYGCDPGYLLVGRNQLMCDVDQRWNGPPPRCEPVYCDEPRQIRYGGFSLSTNSTRFGTVVTFYCTSPRYELVGPKKITCLKDGRYNADPPSCQRIKEKGPLLVPTAKPRPYNPRRFNKKGNRDEMETDLKRPVRKYPKKVEPLPVIPLPSPPRRPEDNEIPDSSNVQSSAAGADISNPTEKKTESRTAHLNLGGIIALGVFGGFVFLAAIITTIVILIRRSRSDRQHLTEAASATDSHSESQSSKHSANPFYHQAWPNKKSSSRNVHNHPPLGGRKDRPDMSSFRSTSLESEVDREHSEMVVNSHAQHKHDRKHHHRHHHHHKHRSHSHSKDDDRHGASRHSRY